MDFWCVFIGTFTLVIIYPYIRCFFKRLIFRSKVKKVCLNNDYNLYPTHLFWFLGNKHSKKCDFYIEKDHKILAIKMFGTARRLSILIIKENGEYFIRRFIALFSYVGVVYFPINNKPKHMSNYDFRYKYKKDWETKAIRNILLINPISMALRYQPRHSGEITVYEGDVVNNMEINSLPSLLKILEDTI